MKRKYIHMSMLIEGPKQPGNDINLYLGLLKEELDTLWKTPANTWDAAEKEYFPMRAALLTTVHDYLGYEYLTGQVCHGYCGCTRCTDDTMSQQLMKDGGLGKLCAWGIQDGSRRMTHGETMEIYSMVRLSIEDLHVSGAAPKSMSC